MLAVAELASERKCEVGKDVGLWRSGSALPWHGRGHGFNPRQLHQIVFTKQGGTAGWYITSRPWFVQDEGFYYI